jgi:hypothetical protein
MKRQRKAERKSADLGQLVQSPTVKQRITCSGVYGLCTQEQRRAAQRHAETKDIEPETVVLCPLRVLDIEGDLYVALSELSACFGLTKSRR